MTTFLLKSFSSPKAVSHLAFSAGSYGPLDQLVGVAAEGIDPAGDEGDAGHAALDAVVAELLRVLLRPLLQLGEVVGRVLEHVGVVGERGLRLEHRDDVAGDVGAERVLGGLAGNQLRGVDLVGVFREQPFLHHRPGGLLVDHDHVEIGGRRAFLGVELLVDLLRAGIAGAGADGDDLHAGMALLEHRAEIVLDVVDHVLVAGGGDIEGLCARAGDAASSAAREQAIVRMRMGLAPCQAVMAASAAGKM